LKVAFIASTYPRYPGDGAGRFVQSIAEGIACHDNKIFVVRPYHRLIKPLPGNIHVEHFKYIIPDSLAIMGYAEAMESDRSLKKTSVFLAPLYFLSALLKLIAVTKKNKIDVLHAHWVIPNGPIAAIVSRIFKIPLIITLHGSDVFFAQRNPLLKKIARFAFNQASAITACSEEMRHKAISLGANPSITHLIPWGADPAQFNITETKENLRAKWDLPQKDFIILSLGRLVEKKGIKYLIEAIPLVISSHRNTTFVIAGDGPEKAELLLLAKQLGVEKKVVFPGPIRWEEVPSIMHASDIFAVPSIHDRNNNVDGLPTTILEAMASSLPIVGSNIAGIPLVVENNANGLLVEEKNSVQLAEAIIKLLSNSALIKQFGEKSREKVVTSYNWGTIGKLFLSFYQQKK